MNNAQISVQLLRETRTHKFSLAKKVFLGGFTVLTRQRIWSTVDPLSLINLWALFRLIQETSSWEICKLILWIFSNLRVFLVIVICVFSFLFLDFFYWINDIFNLAGFLILEDNAMHFFCYGFEIFSKV
jgi:hypothetical protein